MNNIYNSLRRLKPYSFRIINIGYLSVCQSIPISFLVSRLSWAPITSRALSSSPPDFTRDNRIPCVAPANRTEIHTDNHVTFCHGQGNRWKRVIRQDPEHPRSSMPIVGFSQTHGPRSILILTFIHSLLWAYTPKNVQYSKAHSDFRRIVLQSTHASLRIIWYWSSLYISRITQKYERNSDKRKRPNIWSYQFC